MLSNNMNVNLPGWSVSLLGTAIVMRSKPAFPPEGCQGFRLWPGGE